jgi:hypothetical protein
MGAIVASDTENELFRVHRDALGRYTYFLLTAAGAGIGLTVNQTREAVLAWSQIPLAAAVLSWGLSFFCGVRYLDYLNAATYDNMELLNIQAGRHPLAGTHPEKIQIGVDFIKGKIEEQGSKASIFARWQFGLLMTGAVFYVLWHILEMYLRTLATART